VLAIELNAEQTMALCERLKAPNAFRELALMIAKWQHAAAAVNSPTEVMQLLENTDALRRLDRFTEWLQACAVLHIPEQQIQRLQHAVSAAAAVTAQRYLAQGISGKALGEAIQHGRFLAIEQAWF
jgi:tRNA nucleotidyltransferase (CCA-adding enzyme)